MKKLYTIALSTALSFSGLTAWGQGVGINTDNSSPDASAMLDVKSTNKGVLIPRMTTAQRTAIAAPAQGLLVFDQTTNGFWYYDGASWQPFVAGADQDNQTLSYTGSTLTITNGNTVTIPNGDVTAVTAGTGLTGGGTTAALTINAVGDNGLTTNSDDIDLGGALNQLTTISQGANNMVFNLNGTGDFHIQDNGTNQFSVLDNGDLNADAGTFFVDASTNRVGLGVTAPRGKLDVNGDILFTGGLRNIETQDGDQSIQLDDANPVWAGETYNGVVRFHGDGNLAASKLEGGGLQLERRIQIKGGNPGAGKVLTSDANGLASWVTPTANTDNQSLTLAGNNLSIQNGNTVSLAGFLDNTDNQTLTYSGSTLTISGGNAVTIPNGDVTGVTAGTGLTGGGTAGSFTINAVGDNGLTTNANDIDLGGTLNQLTTITQGANNMVFNLNSTGDFHIQDNGTNQFSILDNGDLNADANTFFVDASTNRVGVLTTTPDDAFDVNGDIVLSGGVRHIETQATDQNIEIDDANPTWAGETYGGVTRFYGDGTLSRSKLEGGSLQLERRLQIKGGNPAAGRVLTSDATGLASWQDLSSINGIWSTVTANTHYEIASFALDAEIKYGNSDLNGNNFNVGNGVFWGTNPGEDTGIFTDGDQLILISPGDNDLIQFWEEDGHIKRAYIEQTGGQYFQTSDRNLKQNIQPVSNALSMIMQLNGYRYEHKLSEGDIAKGDKPVPTIGIMAQEVAAVAPELAKKCEQGHYLVNYSGLIPLLIEATKTQENRLQEQEEQLKSQAEQLAEQAELIQAMRAELDALKAKQQD